jgi:hypothetical protein
MNYYNTLFMTFFEDDMLSSILNLILIAGGGAERIHLRGPAGGGEPLRGHEPRGVAQAGGAILHIHQFKFLQ